MNAYEQLDAAIAAIDARLDTDDIEEGEASMLARAIATGDPPGGLVIVTMTAPDDYTDTMRTAMLADTLGLTLDGAYNWIATKAPSPEVSYGIKVWSLAQGAWIAPPARHRPQDKLVKPGVDATFKVLQVTWDGATCLAKLDDGADTFWTSDLGAYQPSPVRESVWYPSSGEILKCSGCGKEDHTGDTNWSLHRCWLYGQHPAKTGGQHEPA